MPKLTPRNSNFIKKWHFHRSQKSPYFPHCEGPAVRNIPFLGEDKFGLTKTNRRTDENNR